MTAIMLESARKGLWKASAEQVAELAKLHTETVNKYRPSCSGFVCDNAKLRDTSRPSQTLRLPHSTKKISLKYAKRKFRAMPKEW